MRPRRREVSDPAAMAAEVKALARRLGASLVGVAEVTDEDLYVGRDPGLRYAVCLGLPMDREEMRFAPQARAAAEVMRTYRAVAKVAVRLAAEIRAMGWPARAYGNPNSTDILMIPLAVRAGLGELGKHGSMIGVEHGSNFRLAAVLTDLPLALDRPVDIGVDDVCAVCRRCVDDCPPARSSRRNSSCAGERKWYVDFDKCIPYFVKTYGCAICIEVCPWSEPGKGPACPRACSNGAARGRAAPEEGRRGRAAQRGAALKVATRPSGASASATRRTFGPNPTSQVVTRSSPRVSCSSRSTLVTAPSGASTFR